MSLKRITFFILLIIIADQVLKIYIKTSFTLQESVVIFSWFQLLFVENDGMAWGTKLSDLIPFISERSAKLILTWFRIFALAGIGYWLYTAVKNRQSSILIIALMLIFAGAFGNIIDSVFYSVIFSDSFPQTATIFPSEGGYDSLFYGKVVDMLHFPIWKGYLPDWVPFVGGDYFTFFEPVFNLADIAISTGVGMLIVFNRKAFSAH
ncbi:MAG: lipoprotein signal peptidase [Flavobacteriaceae bacterium]|nr:lipoprotein signal peptidase [Bacteroidia bacterium]NNK69255.1 lipoprotein signal peptidase [Flavobacteriaceae bacterium]